MIRVTAWVLGIVGAFAAFLGPFMLFAGEDRYLGFSGSTWRVGDVASVWVFGLLAGGAVLAAVALAVAVRGLRHPRTH